MLDGVNFGAEMAYHIEVSLQLASGFMDRPGISISTEDSERLKAPPSDDFFDEPAAPALVAAAAPPPEDSPAQSDSPSLKGSTPPAPPKIATATPEVNKPTAPAPVEAPALLPKDSPVQNGSPLLEGATPRKPLKVATAATEFIDKKEITVTATANLHAESAQEEVEAVLREVRRANFELLTETKGVKSRLVPLTGLSPANISHRLHGHKIFDKETGEFFCAKLGLPPGWFEAPRQKADIPAAVMQLLTGAIAGTPAPVAAQQRTTSKTAMPKPAGVPLARTRAHKAAAGVALSLSAAARAGTPALAVAPAPATVREVARRRVEALASATTKQPPAAAVVEPIAQATPALSALSASPAVLTLASAGPLAQAALAVLTLRVQEGRVSEDRALRLLSEVAAY
jgi:hypothetical protein